MGTKFIILLSWALILLSPLTEAGSINRQYSPNGCDEQNLAKSEYSKLADKTFFSLCEDEKGKSILNNLRPKEDFSISSFCNSDLKNNVKCFPIKDAKIEAGDRDYALKCFVTSGTGENMRFAAYQEIAMKYHAVFGSDYFDVQKNHYLEYNSPNDNLKIYANGRSPSQEDRANYCYYKKIIKNGSVLTKESCLEALRLFSPSTLKVCSGRDPDLSDLAQKYGHLSACRESNLLNNLELQRGILDTLPSLPQAIQPAGTTAQ